MYKGGKKKSTLRDASPSEPAMPCRQIGIFVLTHLNRDPPSEQTEGKYPKVVVEESRECNPLMEFLVEYQNQYKEI